MTVPAEHPDWCAEETCRVGTGSHRPHARTVRKIPGIGEVVVEQQPEKPTRVRLKLNDTSPALSLPELSELILGAVEARNIAWPTSGRGRRNEDGAT